MPEPLSHTISDYSTAIVALLTLVIVAKSLWDDHVRRQEVDGRINAVAFGLRRQLESWVDNPPFTQQTGWAWARRISQSFDVAENRFDRMVAMAPAASGKMREAVNKAYVLFYRCTGALNDNLNTVAQSIPAQVAALEARYNRAHADLKKCIEWLTDALGDLGKVSV
jgi:hypothetical protein